MEMTSEYIKNETQAIREIESHLETLEMIDVNFNEVLWPNNDLKGD